MMKPMPVKGLVTKPRDLGQQSGTTVMSQRAIFETQGDVAQAAELIMEFNQFHRVHKPGIKSPLKGQKNQ